jgi:seryl-tRNA synthetase
MIEEIYINAAKRIRQEYLNNLIYITKEEENIKDLTSKLMKISEEVENSDKKGESYYRGILFDIEKLIKDATEKIIPYQEKTNKLNKEQKTLYNIIKEKYPNITDVEIQNEIIPHILEIDKKYKEKHGDLLK